MEERKGISFLHVKTPLFRKGVFRLWIKGVLHEQKERKTDVTDKRQTRPATKKHKKKLGSVNGTKKHHPLGYNEAKRFSLHLVIKAV